ncbi:hypothetical protein PUNSTDRAFT_118016 [Punctularia strigosozonata HHB-11173 SS5]|uniref:uncharacterized protein n=1 Tax=Punctularia strigosozonata (strain HHB-11173) TaxID=741275 RepID=UPI0004417600|nr:uncharacterized protein PUNSTDRAFT_118016 [Punctularia strigosozonata HHB-11173 SS5]EIN14551.1 hypothetical protein PUNSTDRAFT_118016 [Punctularia strigosozonata HHB-11173 SS5]
MRTYTTANGWHRAHFGTSRVLDCEDPRSNRSDPDIWALVQWYWSANDILAEKIRNFDSNPYGKFERLKSDHYNFVSALCFDGLADMRWYDETTADPPHVGPEDFYYRAMYEHLKRRIDARVCGPEHRAF